jgi:hypothetical protein
MRLSYKEAPHQALTVSLVYTWKRGDIAAPIMSASSGPKDYVKNKIFALFESDDALDEVLMVCAHCSVPFVLRHIGSTYIDATNREVVVEGL